MSLYYSILNRLKTRFWSPNPVSSERQCTTL
jgi:hypothetical protein